MICDKSCPGILEFWHSFPTGTMVHMLGIIAIAHNNLHHVHDHEGTSGWETFVTFSWLDNCSMQLGVPHLHCLYDFLSDWLCVCLTLCLTDFVSVWQTVCLTSLQLSVCLTISVWHSVYLIFRLSDFLSAWIHVCLSVRQSLIDCLTAWVPACLAGWLDGS